MSFSTLPNEILAQIARRAGPWPFKKDLGRLTLCRSWYPFAQMVFQSDVILTTPALIYMFGTQLVSLPDAYLPSWAAKMRSLSITFDIQDDRLRRREDGALSLETKTVDRNLNELRDDQIARIWDGLPLEELCVNLSSFRRHSPSSRSFSLRGPRRHEPSFHRLAKRVLPDLQSNTIQRLELDFQGSNAGSDWLRPTRRHFCAQVMQALPRLPQLKELRLRLASVCPDLLTPLGARPRSLELETLIINTSHRRGYGASSKKCGRFWHQTTPNMLALKRVAVAQMLPAMRAPKMVRILYPFNARIGGHDDHAKPNSPSLRDLIAWDCIEDQEAVIDRNQNWASQGRTIVEL